MIHHMTEFSPGCNRQNWSEKDLKKSHLACGSQSLWDRDQPCLDVHIVLNTAEHLPPGAVNIQGLINNHFSKIARGKKPVFF